MEYIIIWLAGYMLTLFFMVIDLVLEPDNTNAERFAEICLASIVVWPIVLSLLAGLWVAKHLKKVPPTGEQQEHPKQ